MCWNTWHHFMNSFDEKKKQLINNLITQPQIHHSFIFEGPLGSGIESAAFFMAEKLQGTNNCNNEDLIHLKMDTTIKIDEIRKLQDIIKYGPNSKTKLVVIINNAEKLTLQASNAFLKTLEEPPSNVIFILTTVNKTLLLKTILSRSICISFPRQYSLNKLLQNELNDLNNTSINTSFESFGNLNFNEKMTIANEFSKYKELAPLINLAWIETQLQDKDFNSNKLNLELFDLMIENTIKLRYNINLKLYYEIIMLKIT